MIGVIRSEWVKLRRPAYLWVPFGLTIAFTLLFTIVPILSAVKVPDPKSRREPILVSDLTDSHGAVLSVNAVYGLIAMIALVIFAAAVASEVASGFSAKNALSSDTFPAGAEARNLAQRPRK